MTQHKKATTDKEIKKQKNITFGFDMLIVVGQRTCVFKN